MKLIKKDLERDFYFLSNNNELDGKIIYPRVPERRMIYENSVTRRICLSPDNIDGALKALPLRNGLILTVYKVDNFSNARIVKPEDKDVLDAFATKERWSLNKIKLQKIGMIRIEEFQEKWKRKKSLPPYKTKYVEFPINDKVKYTWVDFSPCSIPDTYC